MADSPFLVGSTHDGSVGLAQTPDTNIFLSPATSGKWIVDGSPDHIILRCLSNPDGPRTLEGRTGGFVGLAPSSDPSGTGWQVVDAGGGRIFLKCLGALDEPSFLDGRAFDSVGLAMTASPQTSTWEVDDVGAVPSQIEFNVAPVAFDDGTSGGGFAKLAMQGGQFQFTGTISPNFFQNFNFSLAFGIKDVGNKLFILTQSGSISFAGLGNGKFSWNSGGLNNTLFQNWPAIASGQTISRCKAVRTTDMNSVVNAIKGDVGLVAGVIS
jgi:hypothetical protein